MRQIVSLAAKAAITILLLYFAIGRTDFSSLGERLGRTDPVWLLLAIAILVLQAMLISVRWQVIARRCEATISLPRAFRFNLIGGFFNQVLPSTVGGDAIRIWLFARDGAGWSKATYSVLLDRFVGVLGLAVLVVLCLPWSLALIQNPVGQIALLAIGFGSIGGALAFIALGYLPWPLLRRWAPTRHLTEMSVTARRFLFAPATGVPLLALSLFIHLLTAAVAWCAAQSVAAPVGFAPALLLVPPVMLVATVPISIAGWGVRESALVLAFSYAGLPEADGLVVSVLMGAAIFLVGLIGGIVWLTTREPLSLSAAFSAKPAPPS